MLRKSHSPRLISELFVESTLSAHFSEPSHASLHIDRLLALKEKEDSTYMLKRNMRLSCMNSGFPEKGVNEMDTTLRENICAWSYKVVDHYNLPRQLVAISLYYFDRCLASCGIISSSKPVTWLIGLTSLYLAIKLHSSENMKLTTVVQLSMGQFTEVEIAKMEMMILCTLRWKMHPPTEADFIFYLTKLLPQKIPCQLRHEVYEWSKFLSEMSVYNAFFVPYPSSLVAFACILNVKHDMKLNSSEFCALVAGLLHLKNDSVDVQAVRHKLREMAASSPSYRPASAASVSL